ncbi:MAG: ABC transporter ATP-binding protein [Clostridiales bacterium]|nr:ABC transporter ATP-binding protein [Clostridiales bacterium]
MMENKKVEPIIVARNLTKIYKTQKIRLKALASVDLDIMPGEFVAIVGTSGSGKSTLLSLLAGLESPSAGRIAIKGRGIHRMSEEQLVSFRLMHTGFVFQSFNLFEVLTAQENVAFPLMAQGIGREERMERARELLTLFDLQKHLHHKPGELSGGQQQRVSIARAIISNPDIVFADEPTGNLDSHTADQIIEILKDISINQGTTILMVTHDMQRAVHADRIIYIEDGRIVDREDDEL